MYLRQAFVQDDPRAIRALIEQNSFAQLVTTGARGMEASHLPIMCVPDGDGFVLAAHFAAGNPQCEAIGRGDDALAIFSGPHSYISPAWYETQPSVPTWDFAAVHVYGPLDPVTDPAAITTDIDVMAALDPAGFDVMALPPEYRARMFAGIRAFRMRPVRVEAQWKMSQNRSMTDRRRVVAALHAQGGTGAVETARMIEDTLPRPEASSSAGPETVDAGGAL